MKRKDRRRNHPGIPKSLLEKRGGMNERIEGIDGLFIPRSQAGKASGDNAIDVIVFTSHLF